MKEWLRETHGPWFELLRHFLARFFDSDLTTTPGQAKSMMIWAFAMIAPWFLMFGSGAGGEVSVLRRDGSRRGRTGMRCGPTSCGC